MTLSLLPALIFIGLALWLIPFSGGASTLRDVGKWTYIVALAAYLWGVR